MSETGSRGSRCLHRATAPVILILTSIVIVPGALSAPAEDVQSGKPPGPGAAALNDPLIREQVAAEAQVSRDAAERRRQPEEIAARKKSSTAYRDLTSLEVVQLAEETFPQLLGEPSWEALDESKHGEVVRYYGTHSALIEPQGAEVAESPPPTDADGVADDSDSGALLESTLPLRAETESGALQPVDPALVDRGPYLEPANAAVEARLPDELSQGVSVPELDLELAPAGAGQAASARLVGPDKRLYANSALDTDFLAASTPIGFQAFLMLRSRRSPERQTLELELPPGASLEPAFDGLGAVIERDGRPLATVTPPLAFDADGTYVPVEMDVVADQLVLSTEHRSVDLKYPILVDPVIEQFNFNWSGGCADQTFWEWNSPWTTKFFKGCGAVTGGSGYAIATQANGGNSYADREYGQWIWRAPSNTFIEWAEFSANDHAYSLFGNTCTVRGIYDPYARVWQSGFGADHTGFVSGPTTGCSTWTNSTWSQSVGFQKDLTTDPNDAQGALGNMAVFQLFMNGAGYRFNNSWNLMRGAQFHIYDRDLPYFTSVQPPNATAFVDDGAARTHERTVSANDIGVGVNALSLYTASGGFGGLLPTKTFSRGCVGLRPSGGCRSPWTKTIDYQLPEGVNTIRLYALDQLNKFSAAQEWTQAIDRSAPTVDSPTGSLVANKDNIRGDQSYNLNLSATDGSTATSAQTRSGVKRIEVFVGDDADDASFVAERTPTECNLPAGGCPSSMQATWQVNPYELGEGQHTISVVATDQIGHQSTQQFPVTVTTDIDPGTLTITATPPSLDGSYDIVATGLETRTTDRPVSGVSYMELLVNGQSVQEYSPGCPAGSCDQVHTFRMQPSQSLTSNEVSVIMYDRAGNGSVEDLGVLQDYYQLFGYNDEFGGSMGPKTLLAAYNGGSNVIRVNADWCAVADNAAIPANRVPRAQWDWSRYDTLFQRITDRNNAIAATADKLRVVAVLFGSPRWARDDPSQGQGCSSSGVSTTPPKADFVNGSDSDWRYFVTEFTRRYGPSPRVNEPDYNAARLTAIELWNEPNLAKFWGGAPGSLRTDAPGRFADLVNAGSAGVDSVATSIDVLPGGMSPITPGPGKTYLSQASFMAQAAQNIVASRVDGLAIHLYADGAPSDQKAIETIRRRFKKLVDNAGSLSGKPQWITELGFPSDGTVVAGQSLNTQRRRLKLTYKKLKGIPDNSIKALIVHRLVDDLQSEPRAYGVLADGLGGCKRGGSAQESIYQKLAQYRKAQSRAVCPPAEP